MASGHHNAERKAEMLFLRHKLLCNTLLQLMLFNWTGRTWTTFLVPILASHLLVAFPSSNTSMYQPCEASLDAVTRLCDTHKLFSPPAYPSFLLTICLALPTSSSSQSLLAIPWTCLAPSNKTMLCCRASLLTSHHLPCCHILITLHWALLTREEIFFMLSLVFTNGFKHFSDPSL